MLNLLALIFVEYPHIGAHSRHASLHAIFAEPSLIDLSLLMRFDCFVFQLHHVAALASDHTILLAMRCRDLVDSRSQLTQSELVFVCPRVPLQANATALVRDGRSRISNSLVTSHLTDSILHVPRKVAQAAELI